MAEKTELEHLRALLEQAYNVGFRRGNQFDRGCEPESFGRFDEYWKVVHEGAVASAVAELADAVPDTRLKLQSGTAIPSERCDFVVKEITATNLGTFVTLQDLPSYEREHTLPSIADWAKTAIETTCLHAGCDRLAGHSGVHTNQSSQSIPQRRGVGQRPGPCPRTGCDLAEGHLGEHAGMLPYAGQSCHCDGPQHAYTWGWCPQSGPVQ